jgi:hypothetical protein
MPRILLLLGSLALLLSLLPAATHARAQAPAVGPVSVLAGSNPDRVIAGTRCGAYERLDQRPWVAVPELTEAIHDLVELQDGVLLALAPSGVYRRALGESWQRVADVRDGRALAANPAGTRAFVLAGVSVAEVRRSDDGGRTWQATATPNDATSESYAGDVAVVSDPAFGDVILVSYGLPGRQGAGSRLRRSFDDGASWSDVSGYRGDLAQSTAPQLFVDRGGTTFYAAHTARPTGEARLLRGIATSDRLEQIVLPDELESDSIHSLAAFNDSLIVAGDGGVFVSRQGGAAGSFTRWDQGLNGRRVNALLITSKQPIGVLVWAATHAGAFARQLGDLSWSDASNGLPSCGEVTPFTWIPPFPDTPARRYFAETGHSLSGGFKSFWDRNGGLPVFGYPLSEEFSERNADLRQDFTTQYFERERFEYHPENRAPYDILLGRLGAELLAMRGRDWRGESAGANPFPGTSCESFDVGGVQRSVCGPFLQHWRAHGLEHDGRRGTSRSESLALFGYPLTAPAIETNPDGDTVITQWFERARFEWHPANRESQRVLLGRLGSELLRARGIETP